MGARAVVAPPFRLPGGIPISDTNSDYGRRLYSELNEAEKAIVEYALPREKIDRNDVSELFADEFGEETLQEAFTALKQENRLFRRGNKSEYVMIRRDLF